MTYTQEARPIMQAESVFAEFLHHIGAIDPELGALLSDASEQDLYTWPAASDGSYRAGRELMLNTETYAKFETIERDFDQFHEPLVLAGRATGLAFIRIDPPQGSTPGIIVVEMDPDD